MRISALFALTLAGALCASGALAVDNLTYTDAPDLSSVRAKIKAKDYKAAIEELTPMLAAHQHADVYNLMGFSLRKTGTISRPILTTARRSTSMLITKARSNIWASFTWRRVRSKKQRRMWLT